MFFSFSKYLIPGWQFNIQPVASSFPSYISVNIADEEKDKAFCTEQARLDDAGYRLWNTGILSVAAQDQLSEIALLSKPTLQDEYRFVRKYWGTIWSTYVLMLRLFTFKNPFAEIRQYAGTRHTAKYQLPLQQDQYQDFDTFQSDLVASNPLVAVIIPTLNRYNYLKSVLRDLENQTYKNMEVIVVDQSDAFDETFYEACHLNLHLIRQAEKKLWTARNRAIEATTAAYLLFFDDDSRVKEDWVLNHIKCLDYFKADISAAVSITTAGGKVPENYRHFRWADQFDSGNAMVKRSVFKEIGLFDEQFNGMRMGDGEFGFRAYKYGYRSISNPKAFRIHYKAGEGGLREMGSWDGFRPKKWFAPKPVPSVIFLYKKYLPAHLYRHAIFKGILLSNVSYKHKGSGKMLLLSALLTIIKAPLLYLQYYKANKIALQMLKKDDGIRLLVS